MAKKYPVYKSQSEKIKKHIEALYSIIGFAKHGYDRSLTDANYFRIAKDLDRLADQAEGVVATIDHLFRDKPDLASYSQKIR